MEAVIASVVAVFGTLLGSAITHHFQRRSADRSEQFARAQRLRQERMDAYCAYAAALLEYRRVLVHRWFVRHEEGRCGEDTVELREEVYKARCAAQEAMFRAQMVSDDPAVLESSEQILEQVTEIHWAPDLAAFTSLRDATRRGIRDFVAVTARRVR
ncbi:MULTISPECIES: hypothetical protein [Streptomyces]|uniref:hypothetical protein n=1 Tax=Streptomyces TaxID=1883 RepID=UPI001F3AF066|nr:hypothetical protein [Streptomyces noursei]MCE4947447.1 hypothetical protein [Streptomyces noursei]